RQAPVIGGRERHQPSASASALSDDAGSGLLGMTARSMPQHRVGVAAGGPGFGHESEQPVTELLRALRDTTGPREPLVGIQPPRQALRDALGRAGAPLLLGLQPL